MVNSGQSIFMPFSERDLATRFPGEAWILVLGVADHEGDAAFRKGGIGRQCGPENAPQHSER